MTSRTRCGRPPSRVRVVPAVAGLLAAVAGLLVGLLVGCGSSGPDRAPTTAQITALIARHGEAVIARDEAAFLADVDRDGSARAFRDRQRAQLAALAQVPLQSWRYEISAPVTDQQAISAAARRYGAPAVIVRLSLAYRLDGVDPAPSVHDLWWTFVRRDGRTLIAGDDDLAEQGGQSWRGPWDFGPLEVRRGAHGLVLAHPGGVTRLSDLVVALDAAVPTVTSVWGAEWSGRVAVVVPGSADELAALSGAGGGGLGVTDIAAATVADPADPVTGVVTGQRVLMNPASLAALSPVGLRIVVQHESTHVAAGAATGLSTPRWLVEGFADYVGNLRSGQPVPVAARELATEVRAGRVPQGLPDDGAFLSDPAELPAVYSQAWLACRLIADRAGQAGLVRFYRAVGEATGDPNRAVAAALRSVLGTTPSGFLAQWRAYLRTELR